MENAEKGAEVKDTAKHPRRPFWVRFIHYSIRQAGKRKANKKPENPVDKAARRTANATIAIAFFTLVLVVVSYFQLREIHDGSSDTHALAVAAGKQATWTERLAGSADTESGYMKDFAGHMKDQADKTQELAARMKDQADETKTIAGQAVIQANAARDSSKTTQNQLLAFEDFQSARLSLEDFSASGTDDISISVKIMNRGNSIATYVMQGTRGGPVDAGQLGTARDDGIEYLETQIKISPPYGETMAAGDHLSNGTQFHLGNGQRWWWGVTVVYRDIFGREHRVSGCWFQFHGGAHVCQTNTANKQKPN